MTETNPSESLNPPRLWKTKLVAKILVSLGSGYITKAIINNNVPNKDERGRFQNVQLQAGSYALGGVVAGAASQNIEKQIDEFATLYDKVVGGWKNNGEVQFSWPKN